MAFIKVSIPSRQTLTSFVGIAWSRASWYQRCNAMKPSKPSDFRQFTSLPAELRRKIWEAASPRPSIHVFDVCVPSSFEHSRSRRAFQAGDGTIRNEQRYKKYRDTVFLDVAEISPKLNYAPGIDDDVNPMSQVLSHDPSMYRVTQKVRSTCSEANESLRHPAERPDITNHDTSSKSVNSVYLPGRDRWINYDNTSDILFLRFGASGSVQNIAQERLLGDDENGPTFSSGISDVLEGIWSSEIASTIWNARKIALDVADTWTTNESTPIMYEEVAYLCCCLQKDLAVLYLIDQCVGKSSGFTEYHLSSQDSRKEGTLMSQLDSSVERREPDVIHGAGATFHETFDLEKLGWSEDHPTFVLAQMFNEMIRSQQGADGPFQGVRVLVCVPEDKLEMSTERLCLSN